MAAAKVGSPRPGALVTAAVGLFSLVGICAVLVVALESAASLGLTALAVVAACGSFLTCGAFLALRVQHNILGWLLWVGGLLLATAFSTSNLPAGYPFGPELVWLGNLCWVPSIGVIGVFVPLLFPTGHLASPRWLLVGWIAGISLILSVITAALLPGGGSSDYTGSVPIVVTGPVADLLNVAANLVTLSGIVCLPLAAISLAIRYRRATGTERLQIRWLAAAAFVAGSSFAVAIMLPDTSSPFASAISNVAWPLAFVGFAMIPVAIAVAVLRYHLYDIDLILRRSAVYVPLTAILGGLYAASIALLQRMFVVVTGNTSDAAVVISTLLLVTVFTPLKTALQNRVDRSFRDARGADQRLSDFVRSIADASFVVSEERVLRNYLDLVVAVTHATGGAAYAGEPGQERLVAWRAGGTGPRVIVAVASGDRVLGRIEVDGRRDGDLNERDLAALRESAAELARAFDPPAAEQPSESADGGTVRVATDVQ